MCQMALTMYHCTVEGRFRARRGRFVAFPTCMPNLHQQYKKVELKQLLMGPYRTVSYSACRIHPSELHSIFYAYTRSCAADSARGKPQL